VKAVVAFSLIVAVAAALESLSAGRGPARIADGFASGEAAGIAAPAGAIKTAAGALSDRSAALRPDAKPAAFELQSSPLAAADQPPVPRTLATASEPLASGPLEPDVSYQPWPLDRSAIDRLRSGAAIELPDPRGGALTLTPRAAGAAPRAAGRSELIRFDVDGEPGLLTASAARWFGTLTVGTDTFFFENQGTESVIGNDRELSRRWIPGRSDMRTPTDG
jgi:hypothetical protein